MKKFFALLLFLLFILLAWLSWNWYKETILCCDDSVQVKATEEKTSSPVPVQYGPLVFGWNSGKVITNDLWPQRKKEILSGFSKGKMLRIVGPFFADETNSTTFDNLGLARADAVRQLLADSIATDKIEIDAALLEFTEDAKSKPFEGILINWVVRNENIQEIDTETLIYFPSNSSQKLENANINDYLTKIVANLKGNDKTLTLTGHTDNQGESKYNEWLGLRRANTIKKLLVNFGIEAKRITIASKGETEPIATNDTEEGRQTNRRVVLKIE